MNAVRLVRAFLAVELFKLRRSRLAKMALGATSAAPLVSIAIVASLGSTASVFPEVLSVISASFWLLSGLTSLLVASGSVASEFELGTANVAIGRGTPRWLFVTAKAAVLLGAAAVNTLAGWLCGGLAGVASHLIQAGTAGLRDGLCVWATSGLAAVGIALLSAAAYIGLTSVIGVLTHSTALTMFGGLGLFMVDFLAGEFSPVRGWQEKGLSALSIMSNTNMLLNRLAYAMGADWTASANKGTTPGMALLAMAGYAVGGVFLASVLLGRQDLKGKA